MTRAEGLYSRSAAIVGYTRAFGGQSVVPWELALFLVEEVRKCVGGEVGFAGFFQEASAVESSGDIVT